MKLTFKNKNNLNSGVTLLISIITTSMMLLVSFVVANVALKQVVISSANQQSQYAYYNADTGMECAMYWDFKGSPNVFDPYVALGNISCNNQSVAPSRTAIVGGYATSTFQVNLTRGCAVISVVKKVGSATTTKIDARGYNTCAAGALRKIERGITSTYSN